MQEPAHERGYESARGLLSSHGAAALAHMIGVGNLTE
jgi:hypothetical protein